MVANLDRIYFPDNPWPKGHPLESFLWSAWIQDSDVWFAFELETKDYDVEDDSDVDEGVDARPDDWHSRGVWLNYHACRLDCSDGCGFRVCSEEQYSAEHLDGLTLHIDHDAAQNGLGSVDEEDLAFSVYLLGHDSVAGHTITFQRLGSSDCFKITWSGKIALSYAGRDEFEYTFNTMISRVKLPDPAASARAAYDCGTSAMLHDSDQT